MNKSTFSTKIMITWVLINLAMMPLAFSLEDQNQVQTSFAGSDEGLVASYFAAITPITSSEVFMKTSLEGGKVAGIGQLVDVETKMNAATSTTNTISDLLGSRLMIVLFGLLAIGFYLFASLYLRWSNATILMTIFTALLLFIVGCGANVNLGFSIIDGPMLAEHSVYNNKPFNMTLNVSCNGTTSECTQFFTGCKEGQLAVTIPETWDVALYNTPISGKTETSNGNGNKTVVFTREFFNTFSEYYPVAVITPHVPDSQVDLLTASIPISFNASVMVPSQGLINTIIDSSVNVVSEDPDLNQDLCTGNLKWADSNDGRCCGDDVDDCGRVFANGNKICAADEKFANWTILDATANKEGINEVKCGHYQILSTGDQWVACTPQDVLDSRCIISLSDKSNAYAGRCGLYPYNLICDAPPKYKFSCSIAQNCNPGEQEVLDLYRDMNSHLALPGTAGYDLKVCCNAIDANNNQILGLPGYQKNILKLNASSNTHAEIPGLGNYGIDINLTSNDAMIENFSCYLATIDAGPSLAKSNCIASLENDNNSRLSLCGMNDYNLYCDTPPGYDLKCEMVSRACNGNEQDLFQLDRPYNSVITPGGNVRVCCSAKDPFGTNILGLGGTTSERVMTYDSSNGFYSSTGNANITLFSSDGNLGWFSCYVAKTRQGYALSPHDNIRTFTSNPLKKGDILEMWNESHSPTPITPTPYSYTNVSFDAVFNGDYLCYLDENNNPRLRECSAQSTPRNDLYSNSTGNQIVFLNRTFVCIDGKMWKESADASQEVCNKFGKTWIGNGTTSGSGFCCGNDPDEYFSFDIDSHALPGNNLGYACWNSSGLTNNSNPNFNGDLLKSVVNVNGSLYSCYPTQQILSLNDTSYLPNIVNLFNTTQKDFCNLAGKWYCSYNDSTSGEWMLSGNVNGWNGSLSLVNGTNNNDPHNMPVYPLKGCCPQDYCWNEYIGNCVSGKLSDITANRYNITQGMLCWQGEWVDPNEKINYDWDGDIGFCLGSNCTIVNANNTGVSLCVPNGTFVDDHLCINRTWMTRTALMANELMNYTNASSDFTLLCDNYTNVFPFIEGLVSQYGASDLPQMIGVGKCVSDNLEQYLNYTGSPFLYSNQTYKGIISDVNCVSKACVLRKNDANGNAERVYMALSYNHYNDPNFNVDYKYLNPLYPNYTRVDPNIVVYQLGAAKTGTPPSLTSFFLGIIDWIRNIFSSAAEEKVSMQFPSSAKKIYYTLKPDKNEIYGMIYDPQFKNKDDMFVIYTCYGDSDLSKTINSSLMSYVKSGDSKVQMIFASSLQSQSPVYDYWNQVTSRIRPKDIGATCSLDQGICVDTDPQNDPYILGKVVNLNSTEGISNYSDRCYALPDNISVQVGCNPDGTLNETQYVCNYKCKKGTCVNKLAYFKFDTNMDSEDGNYTGIPTGPLSSVSGISGNSYNFNPGDYIQYSQPIDLSKGVTYSAWVKLGSYTFGNGGLIISKTNTSNTVTFGIANGSLYGKIGMSNTFDMPAYLTKNTWHHVAMSYDNVDMTMKIFIDGSQVVSKPLNVPLTVFNAPFKIGGDNFNGIIDEVEIFNYAMDSADVLELANKYHECNSSADCPGGQCVSNKCELTCVASQKKGDVDGDGSLTLVDAGLLKMMTGASGCCYDINMDGIVNSLDVDLLTLYGQGAVTLDPGVCGCNGGGITCALGYECKQNACIATNSYNCTDSDGGDTSNFGSVTTRDTSGKVNYWADSCNSGVLNETLCQHGNGVSCTNITSNVWFCSYLCICKNQGAC